MILVAEPGTSNASRYLQQLCKHWAHKFEVRFTPEVGDIVLPLGRITLKADADRLIVMLYPREGADLAKFKHVVEDHLDRFAHKEAPLEYSWRAAN